VLVVGFPDRQFGTNCWVVAPAADEQCVVIDPGVEIADQLDDVIAEHRLHPVAVVLTHGHVDHTFSVVPVCEARDVPAYIHPADRGQLTDPWGGLGIPHGTPMFGRLTFAAPTSVQPHPSPKMRWLLGFGGNRLPPCHGSLRATIEATGGGVTFVSDRTIGRQPSSEARRRIARVRWPMAARND